MIIIYGLLSREIGQGFEVPYIMEVCEQPKDHYLWVVVTMIAMFLLKSVAQNFHILFFEASLFHALQLKGLCSQN